jgi:hypothetical protein
MRNGADCEVALEEERLWRQPWGVAVDLVSLSSEKFLERI